MIKPLLPDKIVQWATENLTPKCINLTFFLKARNIPILLVNKPRACNEEEDLDEYEIKGYSLVTFKYFIR